MPKTNAVINMKDINGKKVTKSITDISNNATNQQILDFAQGLVGVTNNYYDYTNKVITTKVDSEDDKQTPTFDVPDNITVYGGEDYTKITRLHYNGTAPIYFSKDNNNINPSIIDYENEKALEIKARQAGIGEDFNLTFYIPETTLFNGLEKNCTVSVIQPT